jgi:hypothetical protein
VTPVLFLDCYVDSSLWAAQMDLIVSSRGFHCQGTLYRSAMYNLAEAEQSLCILARKLTSSLPPE